MTLFQVNKKSIFSVLNLDQVVFFQYIFVFFSAKSSDAKSGRTLDSLSAGDGFKITAARLISSGAAKKPVIINKKKEVVLGTKDVIAVLETEPQMKRSKILTKLYSKKRKPEKRETVSRPSPARLELMKRGLG